MSQSIELVLLKCGQCSTPLPAEEDEVAWVCPTCGRGWQLGPDSLLPLEVCWQALRPGTRVERWLPFWVFTGSAVFQVRESFSGRNRPEELWGLPCRFYIPAYPCELQQLETLGAELTRQQVPLQPGAPAGPLQNCTLLPDDARRAAEFVVLTIEAERKDKLRHVVFTLNLAGPELWVLPFNGEPSLRNLVRQ